jgi:pimeloyl-ACP methyl ester carboxylesterase
VALAPVSCLDRARELNLGSDAVDEFLGGAPAFGACPSVRRSLVLQVLVHGTADEIVPISLSRMYLEARGSDPLPPRLIELPGADHFDVIDPRSACWNRVAETVLGLCTLACT